MRDRVAAPLVTRSWAVPGLNEADAAALEVAGGVLGGLSSSRLDNALVKQDKRQLQVFDQVRVRVYVATTFGNRQVLKIELLTLAEEAEERNDQQADDQDQQQQQQQPGQSGGKRKQPQEQQGKAAKKKRTAMK